MSVGDRIKNIRQENGLSLEEFGQRFDPPANKSVVSSWENGRYLPNNERLKKLAEIGGITVEELLGKDTVTISKDEYNNLLEISEKYEKSNSNSIGQRIKNIRLELGDTLEEFGEQLNNANKSLVSRWEHGKNLPNNERLKTIADIGGVTVDELLYGGKTISNSELELIKKLNKKNVEALLKESETIVKGIKSKNGKKYNARVSLNNKKRIEFIEFAK